MVDWGEGGLNTIKCYPDAGRFVLALFQEEGNVPPCSLVEGGLFLLDQFEPVDRQLQLDLAIPGQG